MLAGINILMLGFFFGGGGASYEDFCEGEDYHLVFSMMPRALDSPKAIQAALEPANLMTSNVHCMHLIG